MNAQVASYREGLSFRQIVAFDFFQWNLRVGFAVASRAADIEKKQLRRRKRVRQSAVPAYLREDVGLPLEETTSPVFAAIHYLTR